MTGYGRAAENAHGYSLTIDLRSVNHRYLELNFKIPRTYFFLEDKLRQELTARLSRGKIDINVNIERLFTDETSLELNLPLVLAYLKAAQELKDKYQLSGELEVNTMLNFPDIFQSGQNETEEETILKSAASTLNDAINELLRMRQMEGLKLREDLEKRIALLQGMHSQISLITPNLVFTYKEKMTKRIKELTEGVEIDPNRITAEAAIFADRSDISEELVRLDSHLQQFLRTLQFSEPIGRKLDFIIQELNREINTIGSKAGDLQIAQIVINFKAELEKMREQVQNIE